MKFSPTSAPSVTMTSIPKPHYLSSTMRLEKKQTRKENNNPQYANEGDCSLKKENFVPHPGPRAGFFLNKKVATHTTSSRVFNVLQILLAFPSTNNLPFCTYVFTIFSPPLRMDCLSKNQARLLDSTAYSSYHTIKIHARNFPIWRLNRQISR